MNTDPYFSGNLWYLPSMHPKGLIGKNGKPIFVGVGKSLHEAVADLNSQERGNVFPLTRRPSWCETMNRPSCECRCPDCGPSLIDYPGD